MPARLTACYNGQFSCLPNQTSKMERESYLFTLSAANICVCHLGLLCGLILSGSSDQPSDKDNHYFCIIPLQGAKQPLFDDRKPKHEGDGKTTCHYFCVRGACPRVTAHLHVSLAFDKSEAHSKHFIFA